MSPNWGERIAPIECMSFNESALIAKGVPQREFKFIRTNGHWTINGETWENVIDSKYTHCMAEPDLNAVEIWKLTNTSGGWFHPVHIHLVDFQVLSRNGSRRERAAVREGPQGRRLRGRERDGQRGHAVRGTAARAPDGRSRTGAT